MALDCDVVLGGFLTEYITPYFPLLKEYTAAIIAAYKFPVIYKIYLYLI